MDVLHVPGSIGEEQQDMKTGASVKIASDTLARCLHKQIQVI